jgi:hypothetical protein
VFVTVPKILPRARRSRLVVLTLVAALAFAACSGGNSGNDNAGSPAEFCDNFAELNRLLASASSGFEPDEAELEAQLEGLEDNAPDELQDAAETIANEAREPSELVPPEPYFTATTAIGMWAEDNCGWNTVALTGGEYAFEGMPDQVDAGTLLVKFDNVGTEVHEAAFFAISDAATAPLSDLVKLPPEQAANVATYVGGTYALPDGSSYTTVDVEDGRYGIMCFVPKGLTPDALESGEEPDGEPHYTEGMLAEFRVGADT